MRASYTGDVRITIDRDGSVLIVCSSCWHASRPMWSARFVRSQPRDAVVLAVNAAVDHHNREHA